MIVSTEILTEFTREEVTFLITIDPELHSKLQTNDSNLYLHVDSNIYGIFVVLNVAFRLLATPQQMIIVTHTIHMHYLVQCHGKVHDFRLKLCI